MKWSAKERQEYLLKLMGQLFMGDISQGELLRILRKEVLGLNQTEYARLVDISRRTLSDLEGDKGSPAQSVVDRAFRPFGLKSGLLPSHLDLAQRFRESLQTSSENVRPLAGNFFEE